MAEITAALVKDLRERSGVGMMDCKKALVETNGDIDAAIDWLRAKGLSKAAKKADRVAAEGVVAVATREDGEGEVAAPSSSTRKPTSSPATTCSKPPPSSSLPWRCTMTASKPSAARRWKAAAPFRTK